MEFFFWSLFVAFLSIGLLYVLFGVMQLGALRNKESSVDMAQKNHYREKMKNNFIKASMFIIVSIVIMVLILFF